MAAPRTDLLPGALTTYLQDRFGCHTAILYGSWARGDQDDASDLDVLAFTDTHQAGHVAHRWQGVFLDLFLYPTATPPDRDWLRIQGGRVLFQRGAEGDAALSAVDAMLETGPDPLSADEAHTRRLWAEKMLARAGKGDPEGHYRRHWLLMALLEDYFALRRQWFLGPKRSLQALERSHPEDYAVLRRALDPSATLADIGAAVRMVTRTP